MELQLFTDQKGRDLRWIKFLQTPLGQLYQSIPFAELAKQFPKTNETGRPPLMDVKGGIGLQILKSYLQLSDSKLIDRLNSDWVLQYFCGINLKAGQWIKDQDYVGRWRRYLANQINYIDFQKTLAIFWQPYMNNTSAVMMDATCYESHLRYPTDVKLLWECSENIWLMIDNRCKKLGLRKIRRKQKEQHLAFLNYQKYKRKPKGLRKRRTRSLLYFLLKGINEWNNLVFKYGVVLSEKDFTRLENIRLVYTQQKAKFDDPDFKIKDRIVSLFKPYIRPIIRGKESKRYEFGAKVHSFQVDGITFVEHVSFDAFNEGIRLQSTVDLSQDYFGPCKQIGADRIYANNANRKFCSLKGITTSFVRKGPKPKTPTLNDHLKKELTKIRATQMEGAFGNEKLHYNLQTIKARTELTEKLWIHFGIWTASAMKIAKRIKDTKLIEIAA